MNARPAVMSEAAGDIASAATVATPKRPHVTIRGLSKRFDKAVIYDRFDLDIPRGELISVFGPNGCGKSTLINMVAGLIPPDAGEILFDGMRLDEIKFGYVFQNSALFDSMSIGDRLVVMNHGRVQQIGAPQALYRQPASLIHRTQPRDHALPRPACRAIALHQGPIGMPLAILHAIAGPHIHSPMLRIANHFSRRLVVTTQALSCSHSRACKPADTNKELRLCLIRRVPLSCPKKSSAQSKLRKSG